MRPRFFTMYTRMTRTIFLIMGLLFPALQAAGLPVAIEMDYHVMAGRQKFIALAAYSDDITYRQAAYGDDPVDFGLRYRQAVKSWRLVSLPENGTLYEDTTAITQAPYELQDPDGLLYVPRTSFSGEDGFRFVVEDDQGQSPPARIRLIVEEQPSLPAGMAPLPEIFFTPAPTPATAGNNETNDWYIDNSHPQATDEPAAGESDPRHGTPDRPRMTLPPSGSEFTAGARVFIAGGIRQPYSLRRGVSWHRWLLNGTAQKPVYIIGVNNGPFKPVIASGDKHLRLEMQYAIIEGLHIQGYLPQYNQLEVATEGHIVMRHCIIDRLNQGTSGAAISMNTGDVKVLYDMHIRNAGRTEPDLAEENDVHGIQISNVSHYWILDALIHDNSGDALQINGESARFLYIGRNKFHSDNENAVDFKRRYDILIVENDIWDYRAISYRSSGSDGTPLIINQDTNGQTPTRCTIARNRIWDTNNGIRHQGHNIWSTDNVLWNLHRNSNSESASYAFLVGNNAQADYTDRITNNTMHLVDGGIWLWAGANQGKIDHRYAGNIFGKLNEDSSEPLHLKISANHTGGTYTGYNLYMQPAAIRWGSTLQTLSGYRRDTGNGQGSIEDGDPLFTGGDHFDLRLQNGSPAIGANIEQVTYAEFESTYGRSIRYDAAGQPRPQNGAWSMGAYGAATVTGLETTSNGRKRAPAFLYPNPVRNELYLRGMPGITSYRIYDVTGRLVLSTRGGAPLQVAGLAPGLYLLQADTGREIKHFRFLKY